MTEQIGIHTDSTDTQTIRVHKVVTEQDFRDAMEVRAKGYGKYFKTEVVDAHDSASNCTLLIARDAQNLPLGTIRLLNRLRGPVEVDGILDLACLLGSSPDSVMEATRLSVPAGPHSRRVKLLLWKALMLQCRAESLATILICVRKGAVRDYERLMFNNLGPSGRFEHPKLKSVVHETYITDVASVEERFREAKHPLHSFFFEEQHPIFLN